MNYKAKFPDGFEGWKPGAKRAWIRSGPLNQREMLRYASDELGFAFDFNEKGHVSNDELGDFVVTLIEEVGHDDPT